MRLINSESSQGSEKHILSLHVRGEGLEGGIPIHTLLESLNYVQDVLDRSYLALDEKSRMTSAIRENFFIQTQRVDKGSIVCELVLISLQAMQLPLGIVSALYRPSAVTVWETFQKAFNLIISLYKQAPDGATTTLIENQRAETINNYTGDVTIQIYDRSTVETARSIQPLIKETLGSFKKLGVSELTIQGRGGESDQVGLLASDAGIFDSKIRIIEAPSSVRCDIFEYNKLKNVGVLRVKGDEAIPANDYKFEVEGVQASENYVNSMLHREVRVLCKKVVAFDPLFGEKIVSLKVISADASV